MAKKIIAVVGARPQFIKHAPIELALMNRFEFKTIHTGQHYDDKLSAVFFDQLNLRRPDFQLAAGSGSHAYQTAKILVDIEPILVEESPDGVIVYGDTNSTLAASLAASKLEIPIFHVEAGLRSYNRSMPEEINRVLTDQLSSLLFCPSKSSTINLEREGVVKGVHFVGDVMNDMVRIAFEKSIIQHLPNREPYVFATIHRPYNTDDKGRLSQILIALNRAPFPVRFALHPRTKNLMEDWGIFYSEFSNIHFIDPVSYFESLNLQYNSKVIVTDSGGIQKEAYLIGKKCVTLRSETEWTETLEGGWNTLLFDDLSLLNNVLLKVPIMERSEVYGDGFSADRIADIIQNYEWR